jgi:putative transposase
LARKEELPALKELLEAGKIRPVIGRTYRRECLDWMLIVNLRHLEKIFREFCAHYNQQRPHRSCQLRPPAARGDPVAAEAGTVRRRARLGGLLSEYYREAVAA